MFRLGLGFSGQGLGFKASGVWFRVWAEPGTTTAYPRASMYFLCGFGKGMTIYH